MKRFNFNTAIVIAALFVLAIFLASGCRARKVAKESVDNVVKSSDSGSATSVESHIDTGKTNTTKTLNIKEVSTETDNSHTKTTFYPKAGSQVTVGADGSITGQADSVKTDRKIKSNKKKQLNSQLQVNVGEIKGVSDTKKTDSNFHKTDSAAYHKETKNVDAKPHYGAWPWVAGIVAALAIAMILWWIAGWMKK